MARVGTRASAGVFSQPAAADSEAIGVELTALETVMRESDFVVINCPLTEKPGAITARELDLMRPGAYLINAARGAIVEETGLIEVLRRRKIAGAALDVFATEPLPAGHPLQTWTMSS